MVYGAFVKRGEVSRSRKTLCEETGLSEKEFRVCLRTLEAQNQISLRRANERANENNIITCLNYDIWCDQYEPKGQPSGQRRANEGPTKGHKQEGKEGKEGKEEDQTLFPFGDGQAVATLPPPALAGPEPSRQRKPPKPKMPTDPLTDPNVFLHRVEAEYPLTVLVWGRDVGAIKTLLLGRLRAGVVDTQAETWEAWGRFVGGGVDDAMRDYRTGELRRAHDIPTFVGHYALLRERAEGNGREKPRTIPDDAPLPPLPDTPDELQELWGRALSRIKQKIQRQSFSTWFLPAHLLAANKNQVVIGVPTQFFADWIAENHLGILREALEMEIGKEVEIRILTAEQVDDGYSATNTLGGATTHEPGS